MTEMKIVSVPPGTKLAEINYIPAPGSIKVKLEQSWPKFILGDFVVLRDGMWENVNFNEATHCFLGDFDGWALLEPIR